jgi:putative glutamine transport system substrate-binding protein
LENGDSWNDIRQQVSGTLIVHYVPSEGFSYEDESGELTGVTVDIIREFIQWVETENRVGITARFVPEESFSRFYRNVAEADQGVIGMANVTITEERREELDFSPPYMQNIAVLITHDSVDELKSFYRLDEQFAGMQALAFEGTLHQERLERIRDHYHPDLDILMEHSNYEILNRVADDSSLFSYIDIYNYWRAAERGEPVKRHPVGDDAAEEFGYVLPSGSDWTPLIQEFFERNDGFTSSDTYREIMNRHLGTELTNL